MKVTPRTYLLSWALAGALPGLAGAQAQPAAKTYSVTTIAQTSSGTSALHEVLSLQRDGSASRLQVTGGDGSMVSAPVTFTAQGEIASTSQDGAVTCYNMAMNAVAHARNAASEPATVFVRFGNSVVQIPLEVGATQTQGGVRTIALYGRSTGIFSTGDGAVDAGIVITATVQEQNGDLHGAAFDELHYVGTPEQVIGRSTCVLQRGRSVRQATADV